jgi:peptidyl-tRNA hydrolase, PTH1 family
MNWFSKTFSQTKVLTSLPSLGCRLVVGLGNPGDRYQTTRHNAGWLWLDHHFGVEDYEYDKYGQYYYKHVDIDGDCWEVIKPDTYMNKSGQATAHALRRFDLALENMVVVQDEVDLVAGEYKYSCSRGDGGHKGIRSINDHMGSNNYCRLRLGVRPPEVSAGVKADSYVLSQLRQSEIDFIRSIPLDTINKGKSAK